MLATFPCRSANTYINTYGELGLKILSIINKYLEIVVGVRISDGENLVLTSNRTYLPFESVSTIPFAGVEASIAIIVC